MKNKKYLDWVKTLPCCVCGTDQCVDAHHILGWKSGWKLKSPDYCTIPLCRECHTQVHQDPAKFEAGFGSQWEYSTRTMARAIFQGRLSWQ